MKGRKTKTRLQQFSPTSYRKIHTTMFTTGKEHGLSHEGQCPIRYSSIGVASFVNGSVLALLSESGVEKRKCTTSGTDECVLEKFMVMMTKRPLLNFFLYLFVSTLHYFSFCLCSLPSLSPPTPAPSPIHTPSSLTAHIKKLSESSLFLPVLPISPSFDLAPFTSSQQPLLPFQGCFHVQKELEVRQRHLHGPQPRLKSKGPHNR